MKDKKKISVFVNASPLSNKYLPLLEQLGDDLCFFYGPGIGIKESLPLFISNKVRITGLRMKIFIILLKRILKLLGMPMYYGYWVKVKILDSLYSKYIAYDKSDIVFINPIFCKAVMKSKEVGKFVIVEAGNSEPSREHERIMVEYKKYGIKHKYIYGDVGFRNTCLKSLNNADRIITISKVSRQTYIDANYPIDKLELIPLTGTDFDVQSFESFEDKEKAFITTAYHNFIKGTHRLLLAWKKAEIKDIPLYIIGQLCEDVQEFIEKYGPFENVIMVGHQSDLPAWYSARDAVGALLSLSEGAVRVTPEMMSFGFPMIVSPDATCDLIKDGINGFIVETEDEDAIANRLRWFADDWERVHEMRKNVLDTVKRRTTKDWSLDVAHYLMSI
jgi:glycosyltransferase involved in cell wall biosynthesis